MRAAQRRDEEAGNQKPPGDDARRVGGTARSRSGEGESRAISISGNAYCVARKPSTTTSVTRSADAELYASIA
jgi:hypothetical protein